MSGLTPGAPGRGNSAARRPAPGRTPRGDSGHDLPLGINQPGNAAEMGKTTDLAARSFVPRYRERASSRFPSAARISPAPVSFERL